MSAKLCRTGSFLPGRAARCRKSRAFHRLWWASFCTVGFFIADAAFAATAPSIVSPPSSLVVTQGNSAGFSVSAAGDAPLTYQWRLGSAAVTNATNSTFRIAVTQLTDAGNYDVVVTNSSGSVTSAVARLTVRSTNGPVYAAPDGGWTYI